MVVGSWLLARLDEEAVGGGSDVVGGSEDVAVELPPRLVHSVGLVPYGEDGDVGDGLSVHLENRLKLGGLALVERESLRGGVGPVADPLQGRCRERGKGE